MLVHVDRHAGRQRGSLLEGKTSIPWKERQRDLDHGHLPPLLPWSLMMPSCASTACDAGLYGTRSSLREWAKKHTRCWHLVPSMHICNKASKHSCTAGTCRANDMLSGNHLNAETATHNFHLICWHLAIEHLMIGMSM